MNTEKAVNTFRFFRVIEVSIYALLATLLIGQFYLLGGLVSLRDVGIAFTGTVFGLMSSCAAAPLSGFIQQRMAPHLQEASRNEGVLSLIRHRQTESVSSEDETRHAA